MGALDFDASAFVKRPGGAANTAKLANPGRKLAGLANLAGVPSVPQSVRDGLNALGAGDPRGMSDDRWAVICADARRIGLESLEAEKALALGWDALDLFGWSPDGDGWEGLAVWARGRRCQIARFHENNRMVDLAFTRERDCRACWYREPVPEDARLLWHIGR